MEEGLGAGRKSATIVYSPSVGLLPYPGLTPAMRSYVAETVVGYFTRLWLPEPRHEISR